MKYSGRKLELTQMISQHQGFSLPFSFFFFSPKSSRRSLCPLQLVQIEEHEKKKKEQAPWIRTDKWMPFMMCVRLRACMSDASQLSNIWWLFSKRLWTVDILLLFSLCLKLLSSLHGNGRPFLFSSSYIFRFFWETITYHRFVQGKN